MNEDGTMVTPDPAALLINTDELFERYDKEIGRMAGLIFKLEAQLKVTQAALRESAMALQKALKEKEEATGHGSA